MKNDVFKVLISFFMLLMLVSCGDKDKDKDCVTTLDCPKGYECLDYVCVEEVSDDTGNTSDDTVDTAVTDIDTLSDTGNTTSDVDDIANTGDITSDIDDISDTGDTTSDIDDISDTGNTTPDIDDISDTGNTTPDIDDISDTGDTGTEPVGFTAHYCTGWTAPKIHFDNSSDGSWTETPGAAMTSEGTDGPSACGTWFKYEHNETWTGSVTFLFNNGTPTTDNDWGKACGYVNFVSTDKEFWVVQGKLFSYLPTDSDDFNCPEYSMLRIIASK